jgi:hypothetical protein
MPSRKLTTSIAIASAAIAAAIGGYSSASGSASATASAATSTASGPTQALLGQVPTGWYPGSGTVTTGASANQARAAALASYPGSTVDRVLKLSDGSYAVRMVAGSWPHHVFVGASFTVTGAVG